MSHIFETRSVGENLKDPIGVARVACIGDSMMYGFGRPGSQSFPAHLSRILNAAYPQHLVFVDNFGHTSGNVWKSWPLIKARAEVMRFDAIVFSVCQNDLQLFESNFAVYSPEQRMKTFDEGTPTWSAGEDLFRDIKEWRDANKVDVLIMFYTYHPGDRPLIDRLSAKCEQLGIAFVDVLRFLQESTAITVATYAASEFDGHPSGMAHEMTARQVAREMRARNFLERAPACANDGDLALARASQSMIAQGVQPGDVYSWLQELCEIKGNVHRRLGATGNVGSELSVRWESSCELAKQCLAQWRMDLRRQVRAQMLENTNPDFEPYYGNLAAQRLNFEELLYFLINAGPKTDYAAALKLISDGQHLKNPQMADFGNDIVAATSEIRQKMDMLTGRLGLNVQYAADGKGVRPARGTLQTDSNAGLESALAYQFLIMDRQISLLEPYSRVVAPSLKAGTALYELVSLLVLSWRSFFVYADRLSDQADKVISLSAPDGPARTIVNVTVEGARDVTVSDRLFDLIVDFVYEIPRRGVIRERLNAGAVKERATYYFEFPLMIKGTVAVKLPDQGVNRKLFDEGRARFAAIEIGNVDWANKLPRDGKVVRWENSGQERALVKLNNIILS